LNPDGSFDPGFTPMLNTQLNTLALQPDGKILVSFNSGGLALARLNADGTPDSGFVADIRSGIWPGHVSRIVLQPDGQVLVGGSFSSVSGMPWHGIARLHNDVRVLASLVVRQFAANGIVRLVTTPAAQVSVYAVEDQPPAGWLVTNISYGGVFDVRTGKVKFGPFFDHDQRTLGYTVLPPSGAQGIFAFTGTVSADGVNTPVAGDQNYVIVGFHPAECRNSRPADWFLSIEEVTAYASAWRRGVHWIVPPYEIPVDYVTRASALWRQGECYRVDPLVPIPPLWWISCEPIPMAQKHDTTLSSSRVNRRVAPLFVPGEGIVVTLEAQPAANVMAYAVEERFPAGWQIEAISDQGEVDAVTTVVRWGPFFDATPRRLSYRLTSLLSTGGVVEFTGCGSFDGVSVRTTGNAQVRETCRLAAASEHSSGTVCLTLSGRDGARYRIDASTNLVNWVTLARTNCVQGRLVIQDRAVSQHPRRFYRAIAE
jgi:hypothetical protein